MPQCKLIRLTFRYLAAFAIAPIAFAEPPVQPQETEGCEPIPCTQGTKELRDSVVDLRAGAMCRYRIHDSLPLYRFHLVGNPETNLISRIDVMRGTDDTIVQTLEPHPETDDPYYKLSCYEYFLAEDVNFDGYKDIRLLAGTGATGNTYFRFWLFDPATSLFVLKQEMTDLTSPKADPATKTIKSHYNGGATGCVYGDSTYKFDAQGKLIEIRRERQDWDNVNNGYLRTISELRNGEMVAVTSVVYAQNDCNKDRQPR